MKPLLIVGDALLDRDLVGRVERVCPDAPVPVLDEEHAYARPGGAALAAALAARDGREVTLLSALGEDPAGRRLAGLLARHGVEVVDLKLDGPTPEKVRMRCAGQSLLRLDRGGARAAGIGALGAAGRAAIGWAQAILVADYGRGMAAHPDVRAALDRAARDKPLVWDPHVRGARPVGGIELATPNETEAAGRLAPGEWSARNLCITRGAAGALLYTPGAAPEQIAAPQAVAGDSCGAGDRFSSAVAGALADGARVPDAVRHSVDAASRFVAEGAATSLCTAEAQHAAAQHAEARARTLVATGGCFDLLHRGHVRMLQSARALGDALVVCLNSDASVRRLKGPGRPVVSQSDRAAVLAALDCVDEVIVFDEDTPIRVLEELRPDVWAKGGDYVPAQLPEAPVVARWGGRVVTLPFLDGHSTSGLLEEVACRVAS